MGKLQSSPAYQELIETKKLDGGIMYSKARESQKNRDRGREEGA